MNSFDERVRAYKHLRRELPALRNIFDLTGEVPLPPVSDEPVADALVRIVAGQMLSRSAAESILKRMRAAAERTSCGSLYYLSHAELRACGLSGRKAKTISLIAQLACEEPERLQLWRELPFEELRREVSQIWGLSDWSASILGIFHFGKPDLFPLSDGSLVRAIRLVEHQVAEIGDRLRHEAAAPFRSYLALTLWAALDHGHLAAA
jgi:DNA-3-methyladenine glycosylase II